MQCIGAADALTAGKLILDRLPGIDSDCARRMRMSTGFRVFALWGAHRTEPRPRAATPTSVDKGVPELAGLGYEIVSIHPQLYHDRTPWLLRKLVGDRGKYLLLSLRLLSLIRSHDVLYTTDNSWARWISALKARRLIRSRLIFMWAGFDLNWSLMEQDERHPDRLRFSRILREADVVFNISPNEIGHIKRLFGEAANKVTFWPTAVDTAYYSQVSQEITGTSGGLVAVGSDHMRDWNLAVQLARSNVKVTILTGDAKAKRFIENLGDACPSSLTIVYRVGKRRSAEIMANAKALLISTLPNERFSGATTVGVAAALRKPLILDEPHDLAPFGLVPSYNCETFERGDVASALAAVERVYGDPSHAGALATRIGELADGLDINRYAKVLAAALKTDWDQDAHVPPNMQRTAVQELPCAS